MAVSRATKPNVTTINTLRRSADGIVIFPLLLAAWQMPTPSGIPRSAPSGEGNSWAANSAAVICSGVLPRARASAVGCRASGTVVQPMKTTLTAARRMSLSETIVVA